MFDVVYGIPQTKIIHLGALFISCSSPNVIPSALTGLLVLGSWLEWCSVRGQTYENGDVEYSFLRGFQIHNKSFVFDYMKAQSVKMLTEISRK